MASYNIHARLCARVHAHTHAHTHTRAHTNTHTSSSVRQCGVINGCGCSGSSGSPCCSPTSTCACLCVLSCVFMRVVGASAHACMPKRVHKCLKSAHTYAHAHVKAFGCLAVRHRRLRRHTQPRRLSRPPNPASAPVCACTYVCARVSACMHGFARVWQRSTSSIASCS